MSIENHIDWNEKQDAEKTSVSKEVKRRLEAIFQNIFITVRKTY